MKKTPLSQKRYVQKKNHYLDLRKLKIKFLEIDGRGPSTTTIESPPPCHIRPITRAMARKLEEDWNTATDGKETYLYMLKDAIAPSVE